MTAIALGEPVALVMATNINLCKPCDSAEWVPFSPLYTDGETDVLPTFSLVADELSGVKILSMCNSLLDFVVCVTELCGTVEEGTVEASTPSFWDIN